MLEFMTIVRTICFMNSNGWLHTDYTIIISLTTVYDLSRIEPPVSSCLYNGLRGNDLRVSETRRMRCRMEQAYAGQLLADYTRPRRDCLQLTIASVL